MNYGRKEDYEELAAKGVNLTGTIALARYGGLFRGLKVYIQRFANACDAMPDI